LIDVLSNIAVIATGNTAATPIQLQLLWVGGHQNLRKIPLAGSNLSPRAGNSIGVKL